MNGQKLFSTRSLVLMAMMAALIAICSWLSLTFGNVTFTLQTFAVFLAAGLLGWKRGVITVAVYILLGVIGVPVFAGFQGGVGVIAGHLGGFIIGFLPLALLVGIVSEKLASGKMSGIKRSILLFCSMVAGDAICFLLGGIWFEHVLHLGWAKTIALSMLPYIIPDLVKMVLATVLVDRLKKFVRG